jgi:glucosamine--fructose-6-phosphate aminotransferase (isomerizing)
MCGIIGYIGRRDAVPVIMNGLHRLEYRGYDSAGIAVHDGTNGLALRKAPGKLRNLEAIIQSSPLTGYYGIGHTRWATHGQPNENNAHPHRDCSGSVAVVHNGIVENYLGLRARLLGEGHHLTTETDTELIAHLIENAFDGSLEEAVQRAMHHIRGVYAVAVISSRDPGKIVVARLGPPAILGLGDGEYVIASDVPAILPYTRKVIFLENGQVAVLTASGVRLQDLERRILVPAPVEIPWDPVMAEKGGYRHFMLKEIHEQPRSFADTLLGRLSPDSHEVDLREIPLSLERWRSFRQVRLIGCGTSWHAALAGKIMIEQLARLPVEVDYGSEFRYRDPILDATTLALLISQSGETADTLAAQELANARGATTIAIANVMGSSITRQAAGTLLTRAGPEIGVASTKAFTSQLGALFLLALHLARTRGTLPPEVTSRLALEALSVRQKLDSLLQHPGPQELAAQFAGSSDFLYLGRGIHFPIALEGALKLKEISYIHAEAYPAGEMKHGPNALIDDQLSVVVLATCDPSSPASVVRYEKTLSNIQEVKARQGRVIAVSVEGDEHVRSLADHVLEVPPCDELLLPVLEVVPLQLLAYYIAVRRGCDVDQPRNLAKSVTVE